MGTVSFHIGTCTKTFVLTFSRGDYAFVIKMAAGRRALHYVLKIGDREASIKFYRDLLGMTPLRHEEFDGMCEATCNGPYDNKWSKTMIGYGPEDNNFVLELTYNYTVGNYKLGKDLKGLTLSLPQTSFD